MRNTTNQCIGRSVSPNEPSARDHVSLKIEKNSVSYENGTEF